MLNFTIEELRKTRDRARLRSTLREDGYRARINVHTGTCGVGSGAMKILDTVMEEVKRQSLKDIEVATSGCAGLCSREPMITAEALGLPTVKYIDLNPEKTRQIIQEHFL
jgi:NADP-reducing hydrogenase subunit HndB